MKPHYSDAFRGPDRATDGLHVLKFGGTSVGDADAIRRVCAIVRRRQDVATVVVVSAIGSSTDALEGIARAAGRGDGEEALSSLRKLRRRHHVLIEELFDQDDAQRAAAAACEPLFDLLKEIVASVSVLADLSPSVRARVLSVGELLSSRLLHLALSVEGLDAQWVDARQIVRTEHRPLEAEPLPEAIEQQAQAVLLPPLGQGRIVVTQGFLGRSEDGLDTTLGRGGSDLTATLLGTALGAREIEIWTDVDGVMSADPSLIPEACSIPSMSFSEAAELAFFGARVLHPRSLLPAIEHGIPVRVKNTHDPQASGTVIVPEAQRPGPPVKSIAYKEGMAVLHLTSARMFQSHAFVERVFAVLQTHRMSPHAVAISEVTVAIAAMDGPALEAAARQLESLGSITVQRRQALVCVVGEGLRRTPGIVARVFEDLADVETSMVSLGGSDIQLGFVIHEDLLPEVIQRLHRRFFASRQAA